MAASPEGVTVMAQRTLEHRVENLERQMTTVEQILPTLATKADLLATKTDLEAAMALLATKAELKADAAETRRHFDVVAEGLRTDVHMIAEGLVALQASVDVQHTDVMRILDQHDRRLLRLEASKTKRR
jgi:hypothetical protein